MAREQVWQALLKDLPATFNSLPMLAVAMIGLALAMISYKNDQNKDHRPLASEPSHSVEIEDDEI